MRRAFTLLELVFVIVIIGILAKIGSEAFRTDYLRNDAAFVALKIRQAQFEGIGFDHRTFDGSQIADTTGCLTLTQVSLEENATAGRAAYRLHASLTGDLAGKTLCFDHLGMPHDDGSHISTPMAAAATLTLTYGGRERNLTVLPRSGYVIIK